MVRPRSVQSKLGLSLSSLDFEASPTGSGGIEGNLASRKFKVAAVAHGLGVNFWAHQSGGEIGCGYIGYGPLTWL